MRADDLPIAMWFLLGGVALLQLLVWMGQFSLSLRLRRIERFLSATSEEEEIEKPMEKSTSSFSHSQKLFHRYLDEDPERRKLPKKEQFAGFRRWRDKNGLNWGKGSES